MLQVNVARLHDDNREALSLAWIAGREGGTAVRREAAKAASLIGHLNLTHPNSIQVVGAYEAGTLAGFVERLFEFAPAAVIIADGVTPPPQLQIGRASCRERGEVSVAAVAFSTRDERPHDSRLTVRV